MWCTVLQVRGARRVAGVVKCASVAHCAKCDMCVCVCVDDTGWNRSGTIAAAEKMLSGSVSVLEAVKCVRRARGNLAVSNESFQEQLVALARREGLLGPTPGEPGSVVPVPMPSQGQGAEGKEEEKRKKKNVRELFDGV